MNDTNVRRASWIAAGAGGAMGLVASPFRSKLFLLALVAAVAGGGVVAVAAFKGDATVPAWAPPAMRVGASFVAAFAFAYFVRRAVLMALFVGGGLIAAAVALNKLGIGVTEEQISELNVQVHRGAEAIQSNADTLWTQIKTYLPSGGAAGWGFYRGVRHAPAKPVQTDA